MDSERVGRTIKGEKIHVADRQITTMKAKHNVHKVFKAYLIHVTKTIERPSIEENLLPIIHNTFLDVLLEEFIGFLTT